MSVAQTNAIVVQRQVSLIEAFLFSLAAHAAILVVLSLLGLLSMLTERTAERDPDRDVEVQFTVVPESPVEAPPETADAAPSDLPPVSDAAPANDQPETTEADAEAPASLDRAQPMIVPNPAAEPDPSQPESSNDEPPLPADQLDEEEGSDSPSSDGLVEGLEQGTTQEPADTLSSGEAGVETELAVPETDDGSFASPQQPTAQTPADPPALGRPEGQSQHERLSEFSRAFQRDREDAPSRPSQEPRNVFEPDWSNLPPTGQALGNMVFESGDYDWTDYQRQIYWIIWRTWHNRLLARVDDFEKWARQNNTGYMEHVNGIRFTIESNGEISSIVVESESNSVPFDLSAVEGLDEAVLPPLPDDFPRDSETVHAQFIGQGEISMMRRGLRRLRDAGVF